MKYQIKVITLTDNTQVFIVLKKGIFGYYTTSSHPSLDLAVKALNGNKYELYYE
jgi:hypothetical protein